MDRYENESESNNQCLCVQSNKAEHCFENQTERCQNQAEDTLWFLNNLLNGIVSASLKVFYIAHIAENVIMLSDHMRLKKIKIHPNSQDNIEEVAEDPSSLQISKVAVLELDIPGSVCEMLNVVVHVLVRHSNLSLGKKQ